MTRRKCSAKQLAALKRGREKLAHKRSKKNTKGLFSKKSNYDRSYFEKYPPRVQFRPAQIKV